MRGRKHLVTMLTALLLAFPVSLFGEDDKEPIAELAKRAEAATRGDRAKLYAELSRRYAQAATQFFLDGYDEQGRDSLANCVRAAEEAKTVALTTRQRLKQTEIALRNTANRLNDTSRAATVDNRPLVQQAIERVHGFQKELLDAMFAKEPKEK